MKPTSRRARAWLLTAAAAAGIAVGAAGIAGAATTGSSSSSSSSSGSSASAAPSGSNTAQDPATMSHGPNETLLTGTTADKVKAAALAAVPNATVIRVETDSAGSPYEAHLKKADGTEVTVKIDASFKVTATESGFGAGPAGSQPGGQPPAGYGTGSSAPSA